MFNLKEYEKENNTVLPYSKLLEKENKEQELEPIEAKNFNKSLDKKDPKGEQIYEKMLSKYRKDKDTNIITEKQLSTYTDSNGKTTKEVEGEPLMDYFKKFEEEQIKDFNKTKPTLPDIKHISDEYIGEDDPSYNVDVITTGQNSQLLSNYKSRKDFRKKNKAASLLNEDAKLYQIFRVAANEKRELNQEEINFVNDINAKKARLILID